MVTKSGVKTTEFWIGLVSPMVITLVNYAFGLDIDPEVLVGMFGGGGLYAGSRAYTKSFEG